MTAPSVTLWASTTSLEISSSNGQAFRVPLEALDGDLECLGKLVVALSKALTPKPAPEPSLGSETARLVASGHKVTKVNGLPPELAQIFEELDLNELEGIL